jgi:Heterokaryon incompatibility protein (HET)
MDTKPQTPPILYKYKPLECLTHIRIFVLKSHSENNLELQCSIEHGDISGASFQCLSYAWGNLETPFKMHVIDAKGESEGYVPLTKSLVNAIRDLRDCNNIQSKRFWADQICINQMDGEEKSRQVAMMGEIYYSASQVITYLGPEDQHDQETIPLIEKIYNHFQTYYPEIHRMGLIVHDIYDIAERASLNLECSKAGALSLRDILFGPWTQRLWMVPENVVNKNTVMLRGKNLLPWITVNIVANIFHLGLLGNMGPSNFDISGRLTSIRLARLRRIGLESSGIEPKMNQLLNLMRIFGKALCSDKRDLVFALLGLANDAKKLAVVPDYSKTLEQVFAEVVIRQIETYRSLAFLSTFMRDPDALHHLSLPSWNPLPNYRSLEDYCAVQFQKAAVDVGSQFRFEGNKTILVLQGLVLDRVTICIDLNDECLAGIFDDVGIDLRMTEEFEKLERAVQTVRQNLGDSDETDAAIAYSFLQDSKFGEQSPGHPPEVAGLFRLWLKETKARLLQDQGHAVDLGDRFQGFLDALIKDNPGLDFCITENKRLCLVPEFTKPGDAVAIVLGGPEAYILRPVAEAYSYVGSAFVHGLMNGEVFEIPEWQSKIQDIHLV